VFHEQVGALRERLKSALRQSRGILIDLHQEPVSASEPPKVAVGDGARGPILERRKIRSENALIGHNRAHVAGIFAVGCNSQCRQPT
jgi:hypothetical protein